MLPDKDKKKTGYKPLIQKFKIPKKDKEKFVFLHNVLKKSIAGLIPKKS